GTGPAVVFVGPAIGGPGRRDPTGDVVAREYRFERRVGGYGIGRVTEAVDVAPSDLTVRARSPAVGVAVETHPAGVKAADTQGTEAETGNDRCGTLGGCWEQLPRLSEAVVAPAPGDAGRVETAAVQLAEPDGGQGQAGQGHRRRMGRVVTEADFTGVVEAPAVRGAILGEGAGGLVERHDRGESDAGRHDQQGERRALEA